MELDQPVDVYKNLNEGGYSVRSRETSTYGTVLDVVDAVCVEDVEFVVQPAGQERVRETGLKNVHAFARGTVGELEPVDGVPVSYRPKEWDSFKRLDTMESIESAERAYCSDDGVFAEVR